MSDFCSSDIAQAIRVGLARANETNQWLASEIGCSPQFVSYMRNGQRVPSMERIEDIALTFDVPVSEFMFWGEI